MWDAAAVDAGAPHVRRVARAGVLALCDRIERREGRTFYADGLARYESAEERVAITPPFRFEHWDQLERIDAGPLRAHLAAPRLVGLLVVRLGGYGAGVYADEQLVSGRHGVRFVKNRNKKGGSSSNRFRRRRSEQARDAYDRATALADEILAPHAPALDEFVVAGDRAGIDAVLERSPLLAGLRADALTLPVHVPELRRAVLEGLGRELWSSTVELTRVAPAEPQSGSDPQGSSGPSA
jgi:Actinobacteria/chloroflexi VLRF1 release factor